MSTVSQASFLAADQEALAALAADEGDDLVIPDADRAEFTENLAVLQGHARLLSAALQGAPKGPEPELFRP